MLVRTLMILTVLLSCATADDGSFVGTWKGEFKGKPFVTVTVVDGTPLGIALVTADIHVNGNGEIDDVNGPVENEEKVTEAKIEGGKLRFKTMQESGDVMEYEMRLTRNGAELVILSAGIEVKPWPLRRT